MARDSKVLAQYMSKLTHDKYWDPTVRFVIIINHLNIKVMKELFQILMQHHVINVVVLGYSLKLYTYNPFENYGCGKRFDGHQSGKLPSASSP